MPPTINHYFSRNGNRTYLPAKVKEYRKAVADAVNAAGCGQATGRLSLFVAVYPASKRKQDLDNRIKGLQDALQEAGVFEDDEQIDSLHIVRREVVKGGKVEVVIVEMGD